MTMCTKKEVRIFTNNYNCCSYQKNVIVCNTYCTVNLVFAIIIKTLFCYSKIQFCYSKSQSTETTFQDCLPIASSIGIQRTASIEDDGFVDPPVGQIGHSQILTQLVQLGVVQNIEDDISSLLNVPHYDVITVAACDVITQLHDVIAEAGYDVITEAGGDVITEAGYDVITDTGGVDVQVLAGPGERILLAEFVAKVEDTGLEEQAPDNNTILLSGKK